jgi:hypothetical protein
MSKNLHTSNFSEPLNGMKTARIDVNAGDGNLTIDQLDGGEQVLASGMLQYFEEQGQPKRTSVSSNGQITLELKGGRAKQPWFHFPWTTCNGATEWQIHLNPTVSSEITAHSDGGNVRLNLTGMTISRVMADTGGGNVEVALPDNAENLDVTAKTGAGNVSVEIGAGISGRNSIDANSGAGNVVVFVPNGVATRIHAGSGLGKAIIDPRFNKTDKDTYQSPDYDSAANKVEIAAKSGAGNVSVNAR